MSETILGIISLCKNLKSSKIISLCENSESLKQSLNVLLRCYIGCVIILAGNVYAINNCSLTRTDLVFVCGLTNLANCMAVSNINLSCTTSQSFTFTLSQGSSGTFVQRTLVNQQNPNYKVNYNIYTSAAKTSVFGDGTQGSSPIEVTCSTCVINLYAFITPTLPTTVWEGNYTDTMVGTIAYQ